MRKKGKETFAEVNHNTQGLLFIKDISVKENIDEIVRKFVKLDILVNHAHVSRQAPFTETTLKHFNLSFGTGFYPTFHFMKATYPELRKSKGKVINFASGARIDG